MSGLLLMLPQAVPDNSKVTPGFIGFVVVAAIAFCTWLLVKSLNKHLGRLRAYGSEQREKPAAKGPRPGVSERDH